MKSAGKARNNGLYRHIRTSKEIIRNLLNDCDIHIIDTAAFWYIARNIICSQKETWKTLPIGGSIWTI